MRLLTGTKAIKGTMAILSACMLAACGNDSEPQADAVYQNGYVYTVDQQQSVAEAVAIKDGEIIYVGSTQGAQKFVGNATAVHDLQKKMMLPGLHDAHIHPTGIVDVDVCDLGVKSMDLDELVAALQACRVKYQYDDKELIFVLQWN
ncbi:MAG: hypothetical protein ACRDA8_09215, partial [Shewanella sp.]